MAEQHQAANVPPARSVLHPQTASLVRRFSDALCEKLLAAEKKYLYTDGWLSPDWMDECRAKLQEHIAKGDPRDVALRDAISRAIAAAPRRSRYPPPALRAEGVRRRSGRRDGLGRERPDRSDPGQRPEGRLPTDAVAAHPERHAGHAVRLRHRPR